MSDYYPPGVTGNEPQIAGEPEPEPPTCPECGTAAKYDPGDPGGWDEPPLRAAWQCPNCGIEVEPKTS